MIIIYKNKFAFINCFYKKKLKGYCLYGNTFLIKNKLSVQATKMSQSESKLKRTIRLFNNVDKRRQSRLEYIYIM